MSNKAERWLAEQEIAWLERIYTLELSPEREDEQESIPVAPRKVRVPSRPTQPSQFNND